MQAVSCIFRIRERKIKAAAKTIFVECRIKTFCAVLLSVARRFIWAKKGATPIYKSGEVTDSGNHRPIATFESFSKVLELYLFLDQFGCRKRYSTRQAVKKLRRT